MSGDFTRATRALLAVLAISIAGIAIAQGPMQPRAPSPESAAGAAVIAQYCAGCHGEGGRGATGPSIVGPAWRHPATDEGFEQSIRRGYAAAGMPAFEGVLSDQQIKSVIAFIRTYPIGSNSQKGPLPVVVPPDPLPTGVVQTSVESFRVEKVANIPSPFGFDFLPDGRILVTQVTGALRVVDHGKLLTEPIVGTPKGVLPHDMFHRQMLDVALHPDYAANGWVYLTWAEENVPNRTVQLVLSRGRIRDGRWVDGQELLRVPTHSTSGGRIAFDGKRFVYFGVIDPGLQSAGAQADAQNLAVPGGKILRLRDDGTVPADNPFAGRKDAYPYIFSSGHRTPLGLAFDANGALWEAEEGPRGGDEINLILPGHNYGWPVITWGHRYDDMLVVGHPEEDGLDQPVVNLSPSPALSSARFYNGAAFPNWKGSLLVGTLKHRTLLRFVLRNNRAVLQETILFNIGRFRDVRIAPDGSIYTLMDGGDLLRLRPARR